MGLTFNSTSDFDVAVALGVHRNTNKSVYRHAPVHGRATVTTGTGTPIANNPFWFPTAPSAVRIKAGGSAVDDAAGNGARQITIVGLDSNLDIATEVLTTAGASASAYTSTLWWRINQVFVSRVGTYGGINAADITIEDGTPADVLTITQRESLSNLALFSVPRAHTGLMRYASAAIGGSVVTTVFLSVRSSIDQVVAPFAPAVRARFLRSVNAGAFNFDLENAPLVIPEKSDVYAIGSTATGSATVSLFANVLLVPNS